MFQTGKMWKLFQYFKTKGEKEIDGEREKKSQNTSSCFLKIELKKIN